jgi:hypothetical protein
MKKYDTSYPDATAMLLLVFLLLNCFWASAQNVVPNGRFLRSSACNGCVPNWNVSHGNPSYSSPGVSFYTTVSASNSLPSYTCGVFSTVALSPNASYRLTFWAADYATLAGTTPTPDYFSIVAGITTNLTASTNPNNGRTPSPTPYTELIRQRVAQTPWVKYTVDFTAPSWSNAQLWIYSAADLVPNSAQAFRVAIDSVSIVPLCKPDVYYQNTSSLPAETRNQGKIIAGSAVTSGTQGPVEVISRPSLFRSATEIQLSPGFSAVPSPNSTGDWFSAEILQCPANNPYNTSGCNCFAGPASRIGRAPTSISPDTSSTVSVFPNPTTGAATLSYSLASKAVVSVNVIDILGRPVVHLVNEQEQDIGLHTVKVPALKPGLYTIKLLRNEVAVYRKLLVE